VDVKYIMPLYKGYSTQNFIYQDANTITGIKENYFGPYSVTDKNLIITDLLNHFYIRKGEKLMNPEFGCMIWDSLFDPLTITLKNDIVNEVKTIATSDPRISLVSKISVNESPDGAGLLIALDIALKNSNEVISLNLAFDGSTGVITSTIAY